MALIARTYRIPAELDEAIKATTQRSQGMFTEADVIRLALEYGLQKINRRTLPEMFRAGIKATKPTIQRGKK